MASQSEELQTDPLSEVETNAQRSTPSQAGEPLEAAESSTELAHAEQDEEVHEMNDHAGDSAPSSAPAQVAGTETPEQAALAESVQSRWQQEQFPIIKPDEVKPEDARLAFHTLELCRQFDCASIIRTIGRQYMEWRGTAVAECDQNRESTYQLRWALQHYWPSCRTWVVEICMQQRALAFSIFYAPQPRREPWCDRTANCNAGARGQTQKPT